MRIITLSGTMRLYTLLQVVPFTSTLERLVKEGLQNSGWNVQSVSITRNSYLNNTLEVLIKIQAVGNDVSQRIANGITTFLNQFIMDGEPPFKDVSLRVSADTGYEAPATVQAAAGTPKPIKVVIKRGTLATVTVKADDTNNDWSNLSNANFLPELSSNNYIENTAAALGVSTPLLIFGSLLLAIVVLRR